MISGRVLSDPNTTRPAAIPTPGAKSKACFSRCTCCCEMFARIASPIQCFLSCSFVCLLCIHSAFALDTLDPPKGRDPNRRPTTPCRVALQLVVLSILQMTRVIVRDQDQGAALASRIFFCRCTYARTHVMERLVFVR
jgi:hypothetical protein